MTVRRINTVADAEDLVATALPVLQADNLEVNEDGSVTSRAWTPETVVEFLQALTFHLRLGVARANIGIDTPVGRPATIWLAFDGARVLECTFETEALAATA